MSELRGALPFAAAVRTIGVLSKNDAVLRAKFARTQTGPKLRVLAVRDRDFLTQALAQRARRAPPTALVADLRKLLEAMPAAWRITEG